MALFLFVAILLIATDKLWALERCCEGLGCYDDSPPFGGLPLPQCPEEMNMVMKVYTGQNPTGGETITRDTIPSIFKGGVMTVFIVHGFTQSELFNWMHDMKDTFLAQGDYNVIIVGWKGGAQNLWYPQPASNTRTVGGEIALVAKNIINNGLSSKALMYCVGHSLGSHICGHAGNKGQFGRITGLDPAGPEFQYRDWSAGLNPSCADLVDVIHTDGNNISWVGIGLLKAVGHIDFYPNEGNTQPGCTLLHLSVLSKDIFTLENNIIIFHGDLTYGCSHHRSIDLFIESIPTPCFLTRYKCTNQYQLPDSCSESSDPVQSMGFYANTYPGRGIFYLTTNSVAPFCLA